MKSKNLKNKMIKIKYKSMINTLISLVCLHLEKEEKKLSLLIRMITIKFIQVQLMKKEYKQIKKFQIQIKEKEGILNLNNANNILMTFFIKYFLLFFI